MSFRFFIDECLSPHLVETAVRAGHEATCSRDRGLLGVADWHLFPVLLKNGYILVTSNSKDFRGHGMNDPGGLFARQEIHSGLICLNSHLQMNFAQEERLFCRAMDELFVRLDIINEALEITELKDGQIVIEHYAISALPRNTL